MIHELEDRHKEHLKAIGVLNVPDSLEIPDAEYQLHYSVWKRTLPNAPHEELHKRTLAHAVWKRHAEKQLADERQANRPFLVPAPVTPQQVIEQHHHHYHRETAPSWVWWASIAFVILALCFLTVPRAHCQFSHINYINWQQGGSNISGAFFTYPHNINCSTNVTCTVSGSTLTITASASGASAFSGLTASTNSNAGTFAVSGNTWDFTAAGLLKLRIAAGLTTASNGEIGYDTTNKNWHVFGNAVDNIQAIFPASAPPTNGNCAQWAVSAGVITLGQAAAACGVGTVTNVTGTAPVVSSGGATPAISVTSHGGTARVQLSDNTGTSGNYAKFAANGDVTDGGGVAVTTARNINTSGPLGGGGALSSDLTLTCVGCLTSVTAHNLLSATHGDTTPASVVLGDLITGQTGPVWARLAGNITSAKQFLTQTGTGAVSANPAWGTIASGDLPSGTATAGAGTSNLIAKFSGASSLVNSSITDNGTVISTAENLTTTGNVQTGSSPPACTAGTAGATCQAEGTAVTNVSGATAEYASSTTHEEMVATNGASSFGMRVRAQPGAISSGSKTAAITTATLCAASAGACNTTGQYEVQWSFIEDGTACATPGTGGVTFLLTWTDANATTHSAVSLGMDDASAINAVSQTFHFQTSNAAAFGSGQFTFDSNGSVIQYATGYTACSIGTGSYQLRATVLRLS